jgi:hypothetical protein
MLKVPYKVFSGQQVTQHRDVRIEWVQYSRWTDKRTVVASYALKYIS